DEYEREAARTHTTLSRRAGEGAPTRSGRLRVLPQFFDSHPLHAGRRLHVDLIARVVAHDRRAHGRLAAELAGAGVALRRTDDLVNVLAAFAVHEHDYAAQLHRIAGPRRRLVDDCRLGQHVLNGGDPPLDGS